MTLLEINLTDVLSETDPDDRVLVWAPTFREGPAGGLVGPRQKAIPLVDGVGSDEVVPGPLMVQVRCKAMSDTHPREVVVPETGPVTLTGLLDNAGAFTYSPAVVDRVALDAQRAEDAAMRAEGVADAFGSLEGVVDQVQAASDAADRAENVVDTVHWQGDQLSVMGKVSPPLTGDDGATPYVGESGTWWVGETDTGVRAQGEKGDSGDGAGDVLWSELNPVLDSKAAVSHSHAASDISDATTVGRNVLKAADAAAARTAIGAGTSSLALGSTSSTAASGNHTHSQYAESSRVTALEGSQPIIVSSLPSTPLPGRIYLVTG